MPRPGLPLVLCLLVALPTSGWVPVLDIAHRQLPLWSNLAAGACFRTCKQPASVASSPLPQGRKAVRLRTCGTFGRGIFHGTKGVDLLAELGEGGVGKEGQDVELGESDAPAAEGDGGAQGEEGGGFRPELIRQKTIQALDSMFAGCATPRPCDPPGPACRDQEAVRAVPRDGERFC